MSIQILDPHLRSPLRSLDLSCSSQYGGETAGRCYEPYCGDLLLEASLGRVVDIAAGMDELLDLFGSDFMLQSDVPQYAGF